MAPGGSKSVVDLEGGGYAVPVERKTVIAPPSQTKPVLAQVPSGFISILPGRFGQWRVVASGGDTITKKAKAAKATQTKSDRTKRLFAGVMPTGISYADTWRDKHGDYLKLARLSFRTLELEWSGESMPADLRAEILRDAKKIQKRRGEQYQVSGAGQTVTLGK